MPMQVAVFFSEEDAVPAADAGAADKVITAAATAELAISGHLGPGGPVEILTSGGRHSAHVSSSTEN